MSLANISRVVYLLEHPMDFRDGQPTSTLASRRYRAAMPSRVIGRHIPVHFTTFGAVDQGHFPLTPGDLVIVTKFAAAIYNLIISLIQEQGCRAVLDLCDNLFTRDEVRDDIIAGCRAADRVIVPTQGLADIVREETGCLATVIGDPFEGPEQAPRFAPTPNMLRIAWFGSTSNLDGIAEEIAQLTLRKTDPRVYRFSLTSKFNEARHRQLAALAARRPDIQISATQWRPERTWANLAAADLVFLPSQATDFHRIKSPNRLIEGLRAGRWVIAHPLESYQAFAPWAAITEDFDAAVRWALDHPADILERITAGQDYIRQNFDVEAIGGLWLDTLRQVATRQQDIRA